MPAPPPSAPSAAPPACLRPDLDRLPLLVPPPRPEDMSVDLLDTNEHPDDLPEPIKRRIAEAILRLPANRYPDGSQLALRRAVAAWAAAGMHRPGALGPEHTSLGAGSDEILRALIIATCLGGRGRVLVAEPTFVMYRATAQALGVPVSAVGRTRAQAIDLAAAQAALAPVGGDTPPVRLVFAAHPNTPTANLLDRDELAWLESLPDEVMVVIDEAYFELSDHSTADRILARPNWVVLRTFSKGLRLAAFRIGYALGDPRVILALEKLRYPYNLSAPAQAAALAVLECIDDLRADLDALRAERDALAATRPALPGLRVWPSAANFLYLTLTDGDPGRAPALAAALAAQGTHVRPAAGGLRWTIGTPAANRRGVERLRALLDGSR